MKAIRQQKILLLLVFFFLTSCSHPPMGRGLHPQRGMSPACLAPEDLVITLQKRLNLTEAQQAAIRPIMEEYCGKRQDITQKYKQRATYSENCLPCEINRLNKSIEEQLSVILTETQLRQFQDMADLLQPSWMDKEASESGEKISHGRGIGKGKRP